MDSFSTWLQTLGHSGASTAADALAQGSAHLDMPALLALAAALGWASGIRLYAVVFVTGLTGALGWWPLPAGLHVLQHPAMLAASGAMLFVEFFADKIPGLDTVWDVLHSVVRIPAGAALAAAVFGADGGTMGAVAALLGGSLAATSFATKAATRAAVNTSPEPFSNVALSFLEDGMSMGALWLAAHYPVTFGVVLCVVLVLSIWLLVLLWSFLKALVRRVRGWVGVAEI